MLKQKAVIQVLRAMEWLSVQVREGTWTSPDTFMERGEEPRAAV